MKRIAFAFILPLMAHAGNLDLVLGGVMDFNKTTTVGRALESWESCEIPLWSEFVTKSSINVVEFSCQHKIDPFVERIKSYVSKKPPPRHSVAHGLETRPLH